MLHSKKGKKIVEPQQLKIKNKFTLKPFGFADNIQSFLGVIIAIVCPLTWYYTFLHYVVVLLITVKKYLSRFWNYLSFLRAPSFLFCVDLHPFCGLDFIPPARFMPLSASHQRPLSALRFDWVSFIVLCPRSCISMASAAVTGSEICIRAFWKWWFPLLSCWGCAR